MRVRKIRLGRPTLVGPTVGRPSVWDKGSSNGYQRERLRQLVFRRDRYTCQYCGGIASTVDHRKPRRLGGTDDLANLVACCTECQMAGDRSSQAVYGGQATISGVSMKVRSFRDGREKHRASPHKDPRKKPSQGDPVVKRDYSA